MSKSFKNKLISGLLTLVMVFSMLPTNIFTAPIEVQAAEKSISDIPNVKMSFVQVDETATNFHTSNKPREPATPAPFYCFRIKKWV